MLAILAGKFDPAVGASVDRSEDVLTDAVFGALRYLPYQQVLAAVLEAVGVSATLAELDCAKVVLWPSYPAFHAPGIVVEPDVVVTVGSRMVVFEAKYNAPFGSYPGDESSGGQTLHQLAVQYAAVRIETAARGWPDPVVVAVTVGSIPPTADLQQAAGSLRRLVPESVDDGGFRWLAWHRIAACIANTAGLRPNERCLADDALKFMNKWGVREVFHELDLADYRQVAAAQRTAVERLYPQLRLFFDGFTAAVFAEGFDYSTPGWKGMQFGGLSTSVGRPTEWARASVGVAYWAQDWPQRTAVGAKAPSLLACFDFYQPAFEVSLVIPSPTVAVAVNAWQPHAPALAGQLNTLAGYEVVADNADPAGPRQCTQAQQVTPAWLVHTFGRLPGTSRLRLRRRIDLTDINIVRAQDLFLQLKHAIDQCPALWDMLAASNQITSPTQHRPNPSPDTVGPPPSDPDT